MKWQARCRAPVAGVLAAALATTATFLFANFSTGLWVGIWVSNAEGELLLATNAFTLGTYSTVHDFWTAGAKWTAITVAVLTGALPYVVLLVVVLSWLAPMRALCAPALAVTRFERTLVASACLTAVAIKGDMRLPEELTAKVRGVFGWGAVASEIGVLSSWALSAVSLGPIAAPEPRRSAAWTLAVLADLGVTAAALSLPAVRFTWREFASTLVRDVRRELSVFEVAIAVAGSTRRRVLRRFWTVWFAVFCLGLPLASSLALAVYHLAPHLHDSARTACFRFAVYARTLASLDCFWVVCASFVPEVETITGWIVQANLGDHLCDDLLPRVSRYRGCAKVAGRVLPGFWWLALYTSLDNTILLLTVLAPRHRGRPRLSADVRPLLAEPAASSSDGDPLSTN